MIAAQVMGNHTTITFCGASGNFELNVYKPVIIYNLMQSVRLLTDGCRSFAARCITGIVANEKVIAHNVQNSLMLVTVLNPYIGYDKAAQTAKKAYLEGTTLKEAAVALGFLSAEQFDRIVVPSNMTRPRGPDS